MKVLESIVVAFSMYSKIPMPHIEWNKENMKNVLCFFPWVGAVAGVLVWLWFRVSDQLGFGVMLRASVAVLIPVLVTGGIHLDGLLDTADALSSWQTRERRLEILKDSHAGAFAIIVCCGYFLAAFGIWTEAGAEDIGVLAVGFILSRALNGFGICTFPCAKNSGLLYTFKSAAHKKTIVTVMILYIALCVAMLCFTGVYGLGTICAAVISFLWYRHVAYSKFGGITGDIAGYFVCICEVLCVIFGGVLCVLL